MDENERLQLVNEVEDYIKSVAYTFVKRELVGPDKPVTKEDLIQVGRLKAWEATKTHDPKRGATFLTYIRDAIYRAMSREIDRHKDNAISIDAGEDPDVLFIPTELPEDLSEPINYGTTVYLTDDNPENDPEAMLEQHELEDAVQDALAVLTDDEKQIILLIFGLADGIAHTDREVADITGIPRTTVQRREASALAKLAQSGLQNWSEFGA